MKKMFTLLIGMLIFSLVFTACGTSVATPTDVKDEKNAGIEEPLVEEEVQEPEESLVEPQQEVQEEESEESLVESQQEVQEEEPEQSEEAETDVKVNQKEPAKTESTPTVKQEDSKKEETTEKEDTTSSDSSDSEQGDWAANPRPRFKTIPELQNWMLSQDNNDQFAEEKQELLSQMTNENQMIYYRPTLGNGNDLLRLSKVKVEGGVLYYYYRFVDERYSNLRFNISCYMDDSFEGGYIEMQKALENKAYGYASAKIENHDVIYRDNQTGATVFVWPQFGGYIFAKLTGKNHAEKVQEVLPYLNLEKVTLRTDLVTQ